MKNKINLHQLIMVMLLTPGLTAVNIIADESDNLSEAVRGSCCNNCKTNCTSSCKNCGKCSSSCSQNCKCGKCCKNCCKKCKCCCKKKLVITAMIK